MLRLPRSNKIIEGERLIKNFQINEIKSLAHISWNCKYHIVFVPKYSRKVFYESKRLEI